MRPATALRGFLLVLAVAGCGLPATAASPASAALASVPAALPDPRLTPGETFPGVTAAQVCVSGYAGSVRNVTREQYVAVYASYHVPYPEPPGSYELDHLIPLELGGDNSERNLWPEAAAPAPGFHQKDELEDLLHDAVCGGRLSLAGAQRGIASNWALLYQEYRRP
jgi:hypothetical protein